MLINGTSYQGMLNTLALGSAALIALNAENEAVPPPISRYGTLSGISLDFCGIFLSHIFFFSKRFCIKNLKKFLLKKAYKNV